MKRICHVTTVHQVHDIRIFHKECKTLKKAGFNVSLVVTASQDGEIDGITVYALPSARGRFGRIFSNTKLAAKKVLSTEADVFHFHDPELIPLGLYLKAIGKKVIYDVHDDIPKAIMAKEWIPSPMRRVVSTALRIFENWAACRFDAIIAATLEKRDRFLAVGSNAFAVNNYPLLSEFEAFDIDWRQKKRAVCYIGGISRARGIFEMVEAAARADVQLILGGTFAYPQDRLLAHSLPEWGRVDELGQIDRTEVARVLSVAMAGLVVLHPTPAYTKAEATKMFEYMAAGIPVIASNFPMWKEIVDKTGCGICVDPKNPEAISSAITWIMDHPAEAEQMGQKGQHAVRTRYNWDKESKILLAIYHKL